MLTLFPYSYFVNFTLDVANIDVVCMVHIFDEYVTSYIFGIINTLSNSKKKVKKEFLLNVNQSSAVVLS
jgi:hypothetical protein